MTPSSLPLFESLFTRYVLPLHSMRESRVETVFVDFVVIVLETDHSTILVFLDSHGINPSIVWGSECHFCHPTTGSVPGVVGHLHYSITGQGKGALICPSSDHTGQSEHPISSTQPINLIQSKRRHTWWFGSGSLSSRRNIRHGSKLPSVSLQRSILQLLETHYKMDNAELPQWQRIEEIVRAAHGRRRLYIIIAS
jgi:hypothetical protein